MAKLADIGGLYVFTLPSGLFKVRAKRLSLLSLLAAGAFPNELTTTVWRAQNGVLDVKDADAATIRNMAQVVEVVTAQALVEPKIGFETKLETDADGVAQGTITLMDLPDWDKQFLFMWTQRMLPTPRDHVAQPAPATGEEPVDLSNFRDESARADAGSGGTAVQPAAVVASGVGDG